MKKIPIMIVLLLMMVSLTAYAGNGKCGPGKGKTDVCLTDLSTTEIAGTVSDIGHHDGLVVDTGSKLVNIYGIGPEWYWDTNNMDWPDVGDSIKVSYYTVSFSDGTTRYVAQSITIDSGKIELRDIKTGCPLWRGPQKH
jgi:hypothetical protein